MQAPEGARFQGYCDVLCLAVRREEARRDKDYREGDRLRDELASLGADCHDKSHTFTFKDARGCYDLKVGLGPQEVQFVALEREEARRGKDFKRGDYLRDWLNEKGCVLDDKAHTLTAPDGVVMSFDLYNWQRSVPVNTRLPAVAQYAPPQQFSRMAPPLPMRSAPQPYIVSTTRHQAPAPHYEPPRQQVAVGAGICRDFENGKCNRGDGCKFSHGPPPRSFDLGPPQRSFEPPRNFEPERAMGGGGGSCRDFENGKCNRGDACKFSHGPPPQSLNEARPVFGGRAPAAAPAAPGGGLRFTGFHEILCIAMEREELRRAKNYSESDRLRAELASMGADCTDKSHSFTWNGIVGSYDLSFGVAPQQLQYVALEREEARRDKDFARSDMLRDWLAKQGATVQDRSHTFTTEGGVTGSFDLRDWQPVDMAPRGPVGAPHGQARGRPY